MNERPAGAIAELLHQLHAHSFPTPADPTARAQLLAGKADLLTRIAEQYANQWQCDHADEARQIARDTRAVTDQAQQIAASADSTGGAKSQ